MLFAGWEVRMVKNGDRGHSRPKAAFTRLNSPFFYDTDRPLTGK